MVIKLKMVMFIAAITGLLLISQSCFGAQDTQPDISRQPIMFAPPHHPDAVVWMTKPTEHNLSRNRSDDAYDGAYYAFFRQMTEAPKQPCYAQYTFKPRQSSRYALFVATTVQGVNYTSPIGFSVNDSSLAPLPKIATGTPQWGPSRCMGWVCLGEYELPANKTVKVHLQSTQLRAMGDYMAFYVNGFFAIDMNQPPQEVTINKVTFNTDNAKVGQTISATLTAQSAVAGELRCSLIRRGETVVESVAKSRANNGRLLDVQWELPSDMPTDDYGVQVLPQLMQTVKLTDTATVHITGIDAVTPTANALQVSAITRITDTEFQLTLNGEAADGQMVGLWLKNTQGHVIAAHDQTLVKNSRKVSIRVSDTRWVNHPAGELIAFVHQSNTPATATLALNTIGEASVYAKPMASGIYLTQGQTNQYWYVRDDHMMMFNGKPFVPFGGMYTPHMLINFNNNPEVRAKQWQDHSASLDLGIANGFDSLYVNQGNRSPRWAMQSVINDFNKRGLTFGWQLGYRQPLAVYPIRSHTKQGLIKGHCDAGGTLSIALPKEKIEHVLLIGPTDDPKVHHIDLQMNLTSGEKPGFIELDLTGDSESGKLAGIKLKRPNLSQGTYYALASVYRKEHCTNLWDHMDAFKEHYQWLKMIDWGENLRLFIDPSGNEEGIYNQSDSIRVNSPGFDAWYATWLEKRYETLDKLCDTWSLKTGSLKDWQQASRLLPLRDLDEKSFVEHVWWIDPHTNVVFKTTDGLGQAWDDYQLAVRISYAAQRDELARMIKQYVNVPVVFKRVAPWVNEESINTTPGGFDGVGLELYPAWGSVISPGLACGAVEARMASQTMWLVNTELGYSAAAGNKDVKSWPARENINDIINTTAQFGAKGYFFFGWHLEPNSLWGNHNLERVPEQIRWMHEEIQAVSTRWPSEPLHLAQSYPKGHAWYFRVAGSPLTKDTAMYPGPASTIKQSIMLTDDPDLWAVSSDVVIPDADPIIINFQDARTVKRYGPQVDQWLKDGKHIIYVGLWPEGADDACQLSQHFDNQIKEDSNSHYQVLRIASGQTILAKDDQGQPWAKLTGRTLIIARPIDPKANHDAVPQPINSQWVKMLLER